MSNVVLSVDALTALFEALADRFPMSPEERTAWVEHCVLAELRGNIMQGLEHLGYHWFQRFTDGTTNWGGEMAIVKQTAAMAILDANGVMGALVGKRAMEIACEGAKKSGVFTVAVRNSPDWMMIGYSTRQALRYDCVGWVYANSRPDVAPWGGTGKIYGHCLISAAIPTARNYPLLMDMAANDTGGLAAQEKLMRGEMPQGLYFAPDGSPADERPDLWGTDNINWGIRGGAQRMSGYRDLALTSIIDAFAGGITGMKLALDLDVPEPIVNGERPARGQVVMAFDIAQFTDVDQFKAKVDKAIDDVKASPLEPGFSEILMPGERGFREEERRRREGVPIDAKVWRDVVDLAHGHGVDAVGRDRACRLLSGLEAPQLERVLGRWQLTFMGVSNAIGAGVLVLTGTMAADYAGPAAILSFVIAGAVCLVTALCYAELSAIFPHAGSAYTYAYASFGRWAGWMIGWCLILGYLVAASTVAIGWSGYLASFVGRFGYVLDPALSAAPLQLGHGFLLEPSGHVVNLPAALAVIGCTLVLLLGVRKSARANTIFVSLKIAAICLFLAIGVFFVHVANWTPFLPANTGTPGRFGWSGVFAGAVIAFFSYTGFEVISTSAQEAREPRRDVPFALIASFWICVVLYISVTLVMTGLVPYPELGVASPVTLAMERTGPSFAWAAFAINALIVVGLLSAILVSLYGQSRIFLVMAGDGLLPEVFARIHGRSRTPAAGTLITGLLAAAIAGLGPLDALGEIVSMGLVVCFATVCLAVIAQRRRGRSVPGGFRAPFYPWLPIGGVVLNLGLVFMLPAATWSRLIAWLAIGALIYLVSGRRTPSPVTVP